LQDALATPAVQSEKLERSSQTNFAPFTDAPAPSPAWKRSTKTASLIQMSASLDVGVQRCSTTCSRSYLVQQSAGFDPVAIGVREAVALGSAKNVATPANGQNASNDGFDKFSAVVANATCTPLTLKLAGTDGTGPENRQLRTCTVPAWNVAPRSAVARMKHTLRTSCTEPDELP
jgi:hypothetical protein